MLLLMRVSNWLAAVLGGALALGLLDYFLRLPGWLRLIFLLTGLAAAGAFAVIHIGRSIRIHPALTSLAMRLERIYPQAAGNLASAVAFATEPHPGDSPVGAALASRTTAAAQDVLRRNEIDRLIDPRRTVLSVMTMMFAIAVVAGIAAAAPASFGIAVQRWANPLGDARWPNRFGVESLITAKVAANNAPLPVAARITKGDYEGLRTTVFYRFERGGEPMGDWHAALMTRQNSAADKGIYQRLIEPEPDADAVSLYFVAGDDTSDPQTVQLIQPPTLTEAIAEITPPDYAADYLPPQREYLLTPPRPAVTLDALEGSRLNLRLSVAGSFAHLDSGATVAEIRGWVDQNFAGLLQDLQPQDLVQMELRHELEPSEQGAIVNVSWTLRRPVQFHFNFADTYGTRYEDQRLFRFEVRPDRLPSATILEPAGDEAVLPTAMVKLSADAQDDVAVSNIALVARPSQGEAKELTRDDMAQPRAQLQHNLDLTPFKLQPGQELAVVAVVRDNYLLDGQAHEPVESAPRRLVIISAEELIRQVRTDLAELRQRAVRTRDAQQHLAEAPVDRTTADQQADVAERLEQMERSIDAIEQRAQRNRLEDERLKQTLTEARELMQQGGKSARSATNQLNEAAQQQQAAQEAGQNAQARQAAEQAAQQASQQARAGQKQTQQKLDELVQLLDQGKDAYELKQQLVALSKTQEALADATRQALPRTLGQSQDQLSEQDRQELNRIAEEQRKLAEQAQQLVDRMRSTSAALSRQSEKADDQATAEALRQAAQTATQQALQQQQRQASQQVQQNQLSQAQAQQAGAQQTIRQMLEQIGRTEQLRQQILQRKLMELVESIRKLRDQQQAQLERLMAAEVLTDLDAPLLTLRRNVLAVADMARQASPETGPVADLLTAAADAQGNAIERLRSDEVSKEVVVTDEQNALAKLEEALKLAEELANKASNQANDEKRQKLIAAYKEALTEQQAIVTDTQELLKAEEAARDRRWRASSMAAGDRELALREKLQELQKQLEDTIVYKSVHEQMDSWASQSAEALKKAEPSVAVVFQEQMIAGSIQSLIDALAPDQPDERFASPQGSGGGAGQQGGGPQPLIPPAAEVKLLKARQIQVHQVTRMVADNPASEADTQAKLIEHLSQQQDDLARTGTQLIQSLQQQQPQVMQPGAPE